jgi:hypothetical protein
MLAPVDFWKRTKSLPIPTILEIEKRRLAIWLASNCCRTTWDRQGYIIEVNNSLKKLQPLELVPIDFPGICLNNTPPAAKELPQDYSEALIKGCSEGEGPMKCSERDLSIANKMKRVYGSYLFVFSAVNNIENTNLDEKFYEPFLSNSVPVVLAPSAARLAALHRPNQHESYIDASQFDSPEALAKHLLWLQANPEEYQKYFDYRKGDPTEAPKSLQAIEETGVFQPGTLCRLCSCLCDSKCMEKRKVGKCGYLG